MTQNLNDHDTNGQALPSAAKEPHGSAATTSNKVPSENSKPSPPSVISAPKAQFNGWTTIPDLPKAEDPSKFLNTPAKPSSPAPSVAKPFPTFGGGSGLFGSGVAPPIQFQWNPSNDTKK